MKARITAAGIEIATLTITSKEQDITDIKIPEQYVDKSNEAQMKQWTEDMNVEEKLQNIKDKLLNAGMPKTSWEDIEKLIKSGLTYIALPN